MNYLEVVLIVGILVFIAIGYEMLVVDYPHKYFLKIRVRLLELE